MEPLLSIGDLATATGISVETLRIWERRYGKPTPVRLPSGHRRYTDAHVRWVRRVAEALARGQRPGKVIPLGEAELNRILESPLGGETREPADTALDFVRAFDREALIAHLDAHRSQLGPRRFLDEAAAPFIVAVGRAWADGALDIRHEHFVTEVLEDYLRTLRGATSTADGGPSLVFATLAGESHGLGLQMAALVARMAGAVPHVFGPNLPNEEIVRAAADTKAAAVCLSVSLSSGGVETDRRLGELRAELPEPVKLVIGGAGARGVRRGPRGVDYVDGLDGFEAWLTALIRDSGGPVPSDADPDRSDEAATPPPSGARDDAAGSPARSTARAPSRSRQ